MRPFPVVLLLLLASVLADATPLRAQYPLELWVRDERTREPVRRVHADHDGGASSVVAPGLGIVRFRSLPAGRHRIVITCEVGRWFQLDTLLEREFAVPAPAANAYVVPVNASRCDQRPVRTVQAHLRGFLESGLEHSRLVPCSTDHALLPRGFEEIAQDSVWVWTEFSDRARAGAAKPWPAGEEHRGYLRRYVEISGALSGPSRYGHLGVAEYQLTVDSLRVIRTPSRRDCERGGTRLPRSVGRP